LLAKFATTTDPGIAERTARACLLLPATGDELQRAVALAGRAVRVGRVKNPGLVPHYRFAQGLADYRQGRFGPAIATMRGDAAEVLGPAPRLVLAMALHQGEKAPAARKALTAAVVGHDWSPAHVIDQDDWICHVLRREAENMILPDLPAFLAERYEPTDNDERLALVGVCQSLGRHRATARLLADAFADDPKLMSDLNARHRYFAARAAVQVGCGRGADAAGADEEERTSWRKQGRTWLRLDLNALIAVLKRDAAAYREEIRKVLTHWQADPELACVRDPGELEKLPADERQAFAALWADVAAVLARTEK
jgi:serine/threonine-protein kinase